ncbi:trypsin-like [Belonocnema kinseyi]|uniref:trypsin-like n=1 Tax=Belonocnema kinseyi TaxID=2817044 RepID=UPI00143DC653|nr:trypsin-like [Belonocnema kinseyi]
MPFKKFLTEGIDDEASKDSQRVMTFKAILRQGHCPKSDCASGDFSATREKPVQAQSHGSCKQAFYFHIRKKRIVDLTRKRSRPATIETFRFVVSVQRNGENICGASILSPTVVITAAHCLKNLAMYWILSGSSYNDRGIPHNIIRTIFYPGYSLEDLSHDLVLLIISPAIDLEHSPNRNIILYNRDVIPAGTPGTVIGWGSTSLKRYRYLPRDFFLLQSDFNEKVLGSELLRAPLAAKAILPVTLGRRLIRLM